MPLVAEFRVCCRRAKSAVYCALDRITFTVFDRINRDGQTHCAAGNDPIRNDNIQLIYADELRRQSRKLDPGGNAPDGYNRSAKGGPQRVQRISSVRSSWGYRSKPCP